MWKNFIRIALRNLNKNRAFNAINISGLTIGLTSAIFIILYIVSELGYDRFYDRSEDIYRLYISGKMAGEEFTGAWNSPVAGPTFHAEIPEIEQYCRFDFWGNQLMWADPKQKFLEDALMLADSSFLEVFSLQLLEGDPATCLTEPNTILLSESKVKQYFPDGSAMGQTIYVNGAENLYRVTGIIEDAPRRSHFKYDFIASYCTDGRSRSDFWFNNWMMTYFKVQPGTDKEILEEKINNVLLEKIRPQLEQIMGISPEEFQEGGGEYGMYLQPMLDIHLDQDIDLPNELGYRPIGNRTYLLIFGVIAFFILVIASINFMNLSTARSLSRAKEVSLRKVMGSGRKLLINQFLVESVFLGLLSLVLAIVLVFVLLQPFNNLVGMDLAVGDVMHWYLVLAFILLAVFVGLLSGSYPAFVLASFKPIAALKGKGTASNGTTFLRNLLVIVQFSISMIIIAGTLVIFWQFRFMTNKDLGFRKDNMIVLERLHPLGRQIPAFEEELTNHASILNSSNSTAYLGATNSNSTYPIKGRPMAEGAMMFVYYVDEDFQETYGFELATPDSRFLSRDFPGDSTACLINEAAVRTYNLEDPLNTIFLDFNDGGFENGDELRVIGVVKNHHYSSLKDEIGPQIIRLKPTSWNWPGYIALHIADGQEEAALSHIQAKWEEFTDDEPLQYFFLDEQLAEYYAEEKRTGSITLIFSILAIFIASLGLFGLTLYNSQKRIREIGIRKVMGATEGNIITVISRSVGYAVGLSILIALPAAYFMMEDWLRDFPYNVGFQPLLFLTAALLAIIIAMITVTVTSLRAARTNPAIALHYE